MKIGMKLKTKLSVVLVGCGIGSNIVQVSYCRGSPSDKIPSSSSDCSQYNKASEVLSFLGRKDRCNRQQGCIFIGKYDSIGRCVDRYPENILTASISNVSIIRDQNLLSIQNTSKKDVPSNSTPSMLDQSKQITAEIIGNYTEDGKLKPIRVILTDQIAASAVDSMKDSKDLANQLAKDLVVEILQTPKNHTVFSEMLQKIVGEEGFNEYTRSLVYWALHSKESVDYSIILMKAQVEYYLNIHRSSLRDPKEFTMLDLASSVISWWLNSHETKKTTIIPLLEWTLKQSDIVIDPLSEVVSDMGPYLKVSRNR